MTTARKVGTVTGATVTGEIGAAGLRLMEVVGAETMKHMPPALAARMDAADINNSVLCTVVEVVLEAAWIGCSEVDIEDQAAALGVGLAAAWERAIRESPLPEETAILLAVRGFTNGMRRGLDGLAKPAFGESVQ